MNRPLVSVMLPTYNQANFVGEALTSALEQDYDNLEVIVSDDGSADGTVQIINDYARKFPDRVVPIVGEPHLGITGNSNRSLRACKGKYIAFHAGDDIFLPGKIATQVEWMERDDRRILCGHDVDAFDSNTGRSLFIWSRRHIMRTGWGAEKIVRYGVPYCGVSVMVRSSAIPPSGYDDRLPVVSDWKLWVDCLASGGFFGHVDGVLARYRRHPGNVTMLSSGQFWEDQFVALALVESSHPNLISSCTYRRTLLLYERGADCLLHRDSRSARVYLTAAMRQGLWTYWKAPAALLLTFLPRRALTPLLIRTGLAPEWALR